MFFHLLQNPSTRASTEGLLRWFFGPFVLARFTKSSAVWISDLFSCYGGKKEDRLVGNQLNIFAFDLFLCLKLWQFQTLLQL